MGETRDDLEANGGPGRRLCAVLGTWVIDGSCTNCGAANCKEGPGGVACAACELACPLWEDTEEPDGDDT